MHLVFFFFSAQKRDAACSQQSTGQRMLVQGKDASVDKLVESPGFHPGHLPVQVRPEVPFVPSLMVAANRFGYNIF